MTSETEQTLIEDLKLFAGPGAEDFIETWRAGKEATRSKFCWSGFLAPVVWFLYRKMYLTAAATVVLPLAIACIFQSDTLAKALGTAVSVAGGMGRRLYVYSAVSMVSRIRAAAHSDDEARKEIAKAGGVSIPGAVIGVLVTLAMIVLAVAARQAKSNI